MAARINCNCTVEGLAPWHEPELWQETNDPSSANKIQKACEKVPQAALGHPAAQPSNLQTNPTNLEPDGTEKLLAQVYPVESWK